MKDEEAEMDDRNDVLWIKYRKQIGNCELRKRIGGWVGK